MTERFFVRIVNKETGVIKEEKGPVDRGMAIQIESNFNRDLNHRVFRVEIVEEKEEEIVDDGLLGHL